MKKPKTSSNDDFSFDFGGGDEFFPLDGNSGSNEKRPEGIKGYFKNVVGSLGRLGVKIGKDLLPETANLKEELFSDTGSKTNARGIINSVKNEVKKYGKLAADIGTEIRKDVKTAVLTGNFAREEELDMSAFFGNDSDFDFGGSDFGSNESEIADSSGTKSSKMSTQQALLRTSKASTRASMAMSQRQVAATIGAAQSQIKHERLLFTQQLEVMQEHHKQKMSVMGNIAKNIVKIVEQNNISNRAQMEYSAKSLAFAQDMAAMIKEIRSAQFAMVKPNKTIKGYQPSRFEKAMNGNFTIKFLKEQLKTAATSGIIGDLLGAKEMVDTMFDMGDMGGSPAKMVKEMIGDSIRKGIVNSMLSEATKGKLGDLDNKMKGLPGAVMRTAGEWSKHGSEKYQSWFGDKVSGKMSKIPLIGKPLANLLGGSGVGDWVQNMMGAIHERGDVKKLSGEYSMGDPNKVHPFDNKAHYTLTEVIPRQLARIDAGVNHTEEMYFDFKSNSFKKVSSIKKRMELAEREHLERIDGVNDFKQKLNQLSGKFEGVKNGEKILTDKRIQNNLIHNIMRRNEKPSNIIRDLSDERQDYRIIALENLFAGSGLDINKNNEGALCHDVITALKAFDDPSKRKEDKNEMVDFQNSMGTYTLGLNQMYAQMEGDVFNYRGGSNYQDILADEERQTAIKKLEKKKASLYKELKKTIDPKAKSKIVTNIHDIDTEIRYIRSTAFGSADRVNVGLSTIKTSDGEQGPLMDYALEELDDDSTHGVVKNIYNLLLEGINVYPQNDYGKQRERLKARHSAHSSSLAKKRKDREQEQQQEEKIQFIIPEDNEIKNDDGSNFNVYFYNEMKNREEFKDKHAGDYVWVDADKYYALQTKFWDEYEKKSKTDNFPARIGKGIFDKVKGFVKAPAAVADNVVGGVAGMLQRWFGKTFYGEDWSNEGVSEEEKALSGYIEKGKGKVGKLKETVKSKAEKWGIPDALNHWKGKIESLPLGSGKTVGERIDELKTKFKDDEFVVAKLSKCETFPEMKVVLEELANTGSAKVKTEAKKLWKEIQAKGDKPKQSDTVQGIMGKAGRAKSGFKGLGYAILNKMQGTSTPLMKAITPTLKSFFADDKKLKKMLEAEGFEAEDFKDLSTTEQIDVLLKDGGDTFQQYKRELRNFKRIQAAADKKVEKATVKWADTQKAIEAEYESERQKILNDKSLSQEEKDQALADLDAKKNAKSTANNNKFDDSISKIRSSTVNKADKDAIYGNNAEEQEEIRKKRKEYREKMKHQEQMEEYYKKAGDFYDKALSKGLGIDKKSTKDIGDAAGKSSGKASGKALKDAFFDFLAGKGGKVGKIGQFLQGGGMAGAKSSVMGGLVNAGHALLGGGGISGAMGAIAGGIGGIAGVGGSILKGAGKIASMGGKAAAGTVKMAAGGAKALGGAARIAGGMAKTMTAPVRGGVGVIKKLLEMLFSKGPLAKALGKNAMGTLIKAIQDGAKKIMAKITGKLATLNASVLSGVGIAIPLATAAIGFTKGCANAKKYVKVGKGMTIKGTMRVCCGVAEAVDGFLMGIPGLIAKVAGFGSLAEWLYDKIGSIEEKEAINRYKIYQDKRAKVYGLASGTALTDYENRNIGNKFLSNALSFITAGIADNSDQKEAKMLGFKHTEIFKYWRENRYKPLEQMYNDMADLPEFGGKKVVEDMNAQSAEIDPETGEAKEDSEANAAMAERIEKQNEFRKLFLKAAIAKVKELGVQWCTSGCSLALFAKMTGKQLSPEKSKLEKAKGVATDLATLVVGGPVALIAKKAWQSRKNIAGRLDKAFGTNVFSKGVEKIDNRFKAAGKGKTFRDKIYNFFKYDENTKKIQEKARDEGLKPWNQFESVDGVNPSGSSASANIGAPAPEDKGGEPTGEHFGFKGVKAPAAPKTKAGSTIKEYDLSKSSPSSVANSIITDFTDKFNKELADKLAVLDKIHAEQQRHNTVTENFFNAALAMMQEIAKMRGNPSTPSEIDLMVQKVVR